MAQAEIHEVVNVDREKLLSVITNYEEYPTFVDGCKKTEVERSAPGQARVTYFVSMMKDITYTLEHTEDREAGVVKWSLVSSDSIKSNKGHWELKAAGTGKTDVRYSIDIEFNFPVPGFILSRLVKGSLPSMVRSFVEKAKTV